MKPVVTNLWILLTDVDGYHNGIGLFSCHMFAFCRSNAPMSKKLQNAQMSKKLQLGCNQTLAKEGQAMFRVRIFAIVMVAALSSAFAERSYGQAFGVELLNSMMPASGGMGGASVARPQDLQSTLMGNPATLTQKRGTQFSFSGGWVEPTINIDNQAAIGNIGTYSAKSQRPGSIVGNIAVTQDYEALGLPVTMGIGLLTGSGLGIDYRQDTASNGTLAEFAVLGTGVGAGVLLTENLSLGILMGVSTASMDGVFAGISGQTPDYNLRAAIGMTYDFNNCTTIGAFWKTEEKHRYEDFLRVPVPNAPFQDVKLSLPSTFGIGVANESLMNGRLLWAVDILYYDWENTDLFGALWENQFVAQAGIQYTLNRRCKLRLGYAFAENATREIVLGDIGGIINPTPAANYIQALFPNINQNRISAGIGLKDVLPGVDMDVFAGGMFEESETYGLTSASIASYWVGFGSTWRFGRGSGGQVCVPDSW